MVPKTFWNRVRAQAALAGLTLPEYVMLVFEEKLPFIPVSGNPVTPESR